MTVAIDIKAFGDQIAEGGYGGLRRLSPESELILLSFFMYESYYRWSNPGGLPLTDEQRDTVDLWTARLQDELMRNVAVIGEIKLAAFPDVSQVPDNWLLMDGSTYAEADYPDLVDRCAFAFRVPGGNFRVTNLSNRVARQQALPVNPVGSIGGANTIPLSIANIPAHTHNYQFVASVSVPLQPGPAPVLTVGSTLTSQTSSVGSGQAHENRSASFYAQYYVVAR